MDADRETKMNLSRREIRVLLLHEFLFWVVKQRNQQTTYAAQGAEILSPHVRHSVGSIGSTLGSLNWMLHLALEDRLK